MFEIINQYSAVIVIPGFLVAMFALLPIRSWRKRIPLYSGVAIAGIAAMLILQPGDSTVVSESMPFTGSFSGIRLLTCTPN